MPETHKPKPMKPPRKSRFSERMPEVKKSIIDRISAGEPLRAICREDGYPSAQVVYDWIEKDEEFALRFARARDIGADAIAEECLRIADSPLTGEETEVDADGKVVKVKRADMLGHRKLQIETRLKLLAKWNPKKYGERIDHTSSDGSMTPTRFKTLADFYGEGGEK